jgi:hypothetical protein
MVTAEFDTPERQRQAAQGFVVRKRSPITPLSPVRWQHDKLRIGYFSVDFKLHAANRLIFAGRVMPAAMAEPPQLAFESALALGDVWALDQLWKELGFDPPAMCASTAWPSGAD